MGLIRCLRQLPRFRRAVRLCSRAFHAIDAGRHREALDYYEEALSLIGDPEDDSYLVGVHMEVRRCAYTGFANLADPLGVPALKVRAAREGLPFWEELATVNAGCREMAAWAREYLEKHRGPLN